MQKKSEFSKEPPLTIQLGIPMGLLILALAVTACLAAGLLQKPVEKTGAQTNGAELSRKPKN